MTAQSLTETSLQWLVSCMLLQNSVTRHVEATF